MSVFGERPHRRLRLCPKAITVFPFFFVTVGETASPCFTPGPSIS